MCCVGFIVFPLLSASSMHFSKNMISFGARKFSDYKKIPGYAYQNLNSHFYLPLSCAKTRASKRQKVEPLQAGLQVAGQARAKRQVSDLPPAHIPASCLTVSVFTTKPLEIDAQDHCLHSYQHLLLAFSPFLLLLILLPPPPVFFSLTNFKTNLKHHSLLLILFHTSQIVNSK